MGVFAPLVGIIGAMQAAEALKLLLQLPGTLTGRILLLDALSMEWSDMRLPRNTACTVCGTSSGHN
jgi:molybdopterin/thiamine biosynthesis adenylyltransferase